MSISVVRRFHMDINGASHALTEDEAIDLARALIAALGSRTIVALADSNDAVMGPVRAAMAEPAALPSGPVAISPPVLPIDRPGPDGTLIDKRGLKMGDWTKDIPELRRLHAEGLTMREIAARLNRPLPATQAKAGKIGLTRFSMTRIDPDEPARKTPTSVSTIDSPIPSIPVANAPIASVDELRPVAGWTLAQTKSLIREMGVGQGGLREAAARTGHTMGSCALRWRHLKEAGLMSVEAYMASPEAVK